MKIGLDFDGVVSDCGDLKSQGAKKLYGVNIPPEKFKTEIVVGEGLLTKEQYRYLQKQIYETRDLGLMMKPVEGVLNFLPRLQEKHNIRIITSRNEQSLDIVREWMQNFSLDVNVVGTSGGSKANYCIGMEVYIDDDIDKLEQLVDVVPNRFLFSWGYNQHIKLNPAVGKRVSSWEDIYNKIINLD